MTATLSLLPEIHDDAAAGGPAPVRPADPGLSLEIVSDCTTLPWNGYECLGQSDNGLAAFAVTLTVRAELADRHAMDLLDPAPGPRRWPRGLRLWRSSVRSVTLIFYKRTGGNELSRQAALRCDFAGAYGAPVEVDGVRLCEITLLDPGVIPDQEPENQLGDRERLFRIPGGKPPLLIGRLETELDALVESVRGRKDAAEIVKGWFASGGKDETVVEREGGKADPPRDWSFTGFCMEVARHYPLNTDAHLGFVVTVPKTWLPEKPEELLVVAIPSFGTRDRTGDSELNTADLGIADFKLADGVVRAATLNMGTEAQVTVAAQPKSVIPKKDPIAPLDASTLLVRLGTKKGAAPRVDDGEWLRNVEPCVHASFLVADHAAAQWEELWAACSDDGPPSPAALLGLLRDWIASLRDMTGIGAWCTDGEFNEAFKNAPKADRDNAASRRRLMLPERLAEAGLAPDVCAGLKDILGARNVALDQLGTWGRALSSGLRAAKQSGELIDSIPAMCLSDPGRSIPEDTAHAMYALNDLGLAEFGAQARRIASSLSVSPILQEVVLADWFAHMSAETSAKSREILAGALSSFREGAENHDLAAVARRTLAAPLWDAAVDTIGASEDQIDPFPAVKEMLRRRRMTPQPAATDPTEHDFAQPRLSAGKLEDLLLAARGPEPSILRARVNETMRPARPSPVDVPRAPGEPPAPLVFRVDRSTPANASREREAEDYARRLSGFGLLLRRADGPDATDWSCVNVGVRAIDGLDSKTLREAQGAAGTSAEIVRAARRTLTQALLENPAHIGEHVSPLRLGFAAGLRQTTIAYDGASLIGAAAESLWPQDLPADVLPGDKLEDASFASPLFWLTPGPPRTRRTGGACVPVRDAQSWHSIPAMRFASTYLGVAFGVLNVGALAPRVASKSHPCLPETDMAAIRTRIDELAGLSEFERYVGSMRYERTTGVSSPVLEPRLGENGTPPLGPGVFAASTVGVELVAPGDDAVVVASVRGVRAMDLECAVPVSDLHLEPAPCAACVSTCVVELELRRGDETFVVAIGRAPGSKADKCGWSLSGQRFKVGEESTPLSKPDEPIALDNVPTHAALSVQLRPAGVRGSHVEATLSAVWSEESIRPETQNGDDGLLLAGLEQKRSAKATLTAIVWHPEAGRPVPVAMHLPIRGTDRCDATLRVRARGGVAVIGRPELLIAGQADARGQTAAYHVRERSAGLTLRPPATSLRTWLRSPLRTSAGPVSARARAIVELVDRFLRATAADYRGEAGSVVHALAPCDPVVTHVVFELVPLFRPHGHTGEPDPGAVRVPMELSSQRLASHIREHLKGSARFAEMLSKCGLLASDGASMPDGGDTPISHLPIDINVSYLASTKKSSITRIGSQGLQVVVAEGEAVELRCYPARADDGSSEGLCKAARESLRTLSVGGEKYVVATPARVRLDALPTTETAAHHVPTPAELLSCLHARIEHVSRAEGSSARDAVLSLAIPTRLVRAFAFVKHVEGRRQQWRWRGEVFRTPSGPETPSHPVPVRGDDGRDKTTPWGDQRFDLSLAQWESIASVAQPESAYEVADMPLPWRATRLELMRRRLDSSASFHRFTAAATPLVVPKGAKSPLVVAFIEPKAEGDRWAIGMMRANGGFADGFDHPPRLSWKRLHAPCVMGGTLPAPKIWLVLPMSRRANQSPGGDDGGRATIAAAMVIVIGGAFEHAGWGEDLDCQVMSVTDEIAQQSVTQWDVGSVPGLTGESFSVAADGPARLPRATVAAGPIGHTLDPAGVLDPLITASSYIIELGSIDSWLAGHKGPGRLSRPLDARVQFRRVLRRDSLGGSFYSAGDPLLPAPSEWTPPVLLRFGVDAGELAAQLGLAQSQLSNDQRKLLLPDSQIAAEYIERGRDANCQLWVLLTELAFDATTDSEQFFGIAPLTESGLLGTQKGKGFAVAAAGTSQAGSRHLARVMVVQADMREGGQAEGLLTKEYAGELRNLAYLLMPWSSAEELDRDPWNRPEARARVVAVSDHVEISMSLSSR